MMITGVLLGAALAACGDPDAGNTTPDARTPDARTADAPAGDAVPADGPAASFDLTFNGTGYTPHNTQTLKAAVVEVPGGTVVATDSVTVSGGAFSFSWTGVLGQGKDYEVRYYADVNSNGVCDASPVDHTWIATINDVTADQTLAQTHSTNFAAACGTWFGHALTFNGTGFAPHNGQTLHIAVVAADDSVVATDSATVAAGEISFTWPELLVDGRAYRVRLYADHNSNGQCDAPPTDHAWEIDLGTVTAAVVENYAHNTTFTNVCASF